MEHISNRIHNRNLICAVPYDSIEELVELISKRFMVNNILKGWIVYNINLDPIKIQYSKYQANV